MPRSEGTTALTEKAIIKEKALRGTRRRTRHFSLGHGEGLLRSHESHFSEEGPESDLALTSQCLLPKPSQCLHLNRLSPSQCLLRNECLLLKVVLTSLLTLLPVQ